MGKLKSCCAIKLPRDEAAFSLPIVLAFAAAVPIAVGVYISIPRLLGKACYRQAHSLQAVLSARSGVWTGLQEISVSTDSTALPRPSQIGERLGLGLFDKSVPSRKRGRLVPDESGITVILPGKQHSSACLLKAERDFFFLRLRATGTFRDRTASIAVQIAGHSRHSGDTVVFLSRPCAEIDRCCLANGKLSLPSPLRAGAAKDSLPLPLALNRLELAQFISHYQEMLQTAAKETDRHAITHIRNGKELAEAKDPIGGDCLIDGTIFPVIADGGPLLRVVGDLQLSGIVGWSNKTIVVGGDIKIFGAAELRNMRLFTRNRIYFGEEKIRRKISFSGQAFAMRAIEICDGAHIKDRSMIVHWDTLEVSKEGNASASAESPYAVFIRTGAAVDGIVGCISPAKGICTFPNAKVTGILWSTKSICHKGELRGFLAAESLIEVTVEPGKLPGVVKRLPSISEYIVPYFAGISAPVTWLEYDKND